MHPLQGAQIRSLVRELRSLMPHSVTNKEKKMTRNLSDKWFCRTEIGLESLHEEDIETELST